MPLSSRLWFIAAALIAVVGIAGEITSSHAEHLPNSDTVSITSTDDPDDSRIKFRFIRGCDSSTGTGSLCLSVLRFKNGEAKEFSDPACIPIVCSAPDPDPGNGE